MTKQQVYHSIEWSVALAACAFLIWKLATYEDYAGLWATLREMEWSQWLAIGVCVALMPLNMTLEAWRWKTLMNEGVKELKNEGMNWREAHRQVYYSKLAGLITPWKLGEYPARALLMNESQESRVKSQEIWSRALSMGAVGSATMTAAIVVSGAVGLVGLDGLDVLDGLGYYILIGGILVVLGVGLWYAPRLLRRWATVSHKLVAISLVQSFVRLLCWCVQLGLVIFALGGIGNIGVLGGLERSAIYYLFVTITPNVPIAEVGVRGAWAIVVFGSVNAALAGVLLWVINTLLPCIVWPFLRKNDKKFA